MDMHEDGGVVGGGGDGTIGHAVVADLAVLQGGLGEAVDPRAEHGGALVAIAQICYVITYLFTSLPSGIGMCYSDDVGGRVPHAPGRSRVPGWGTPSASGFYQARASSQVL